MKPEPLHNDDTEAILERRRFLIRSTLAGLGVAAATTVSGCGESKPKAKGEPEPCLKVMAPNDKPEPKPCLSVTKPKPPDATAEPHIVRPEAEICLSIMPDPPDPKADSPEDKPVPKK